MQRPHNGNMEIPRLPDCNNVLVYAPVGSGKTWLLKKWMESMERSLILDTAADCMGPEYSHVWYSPAQLLEFLKKNPWYYRISYHPSPGSGLLTDFEWCTTGMWLTCDTSKGDRRSMPRWFIVDEISKLYEGDNDAAVDEKLDLLARYPRHNLLGFIGATQRMVDVDRIMSSNCRMVVMFYTPDEVDLERIKKRFGKEIYAQVKNLRPCIFNDATQECEQEPECLVWVRGVGARVFALGDKVKSGASLETPIIAAQEEEPEWQESLKPLEEVPPTEEV